ncbi:hypothetical protein BGZ52_006189 [Haplosporangium bisporale]|nr:hypothetical protein BGZ52_006189 [Haplosporangium bisporale]
MDNGLTSLYHAPQRLILVILPKDLFSKFLQDQCSRESETTVETRMTRIQVAKRSYSVLVPVKVILEKCSRLRKLSISFSFMGAVTWGEDHCRGVMSTSSSSAAKEEKYERNRQEAGRGTCNKQSPLRALVLQNIQSSFHDLIQWLGHLPRLDTLKLQTLRFIGAKATYIDADTIRPEFYAHIGAACPAVQSFHISFDSLHRQ